MVVRESKHLRIKRETFVFKNASFFPAGVGAAVRPSKRRTPPIVHPREKEREKERERRFASLLSASSAMGCESSQPMVANAGKNEVDDELERLHKEERQHYKV